MLIGFPFRSTVKLLDPKVPLAAIMVTSSPVAGEAGRVTCIGLAVVFAKLVHQLPQYKEYLNL